MLKAARLCYTVDLRTRKGRAALERPRPGQPLKGAIDMTDLTPTPYFPQDPENYAPWVARRGLRYPYGECQCGCGAVVNLARSTVDKYGWIVGHPMAYIAGHRQGPLYPTLEDAFWAHVKKGNEGQCWDWQGHIPAGRGYGVLNYNRKFYRVHRLSWEIHNGPIPDGLFVCHTCDRRRCVNISHLWLGTHEDNQNDKIEKGRTPKGQDAGPSKLLEADVREMKRLFHQGAKRKDIAAIFGVPYYTLCDILNGRTWSHIT